MLKNEFSPYYIAGVRLSWNFGSLYTLKNDRRVIEKKRQQTTFWNDFSIADRFGLSAIQDTFNRAFEEWKENYKYLTELVLVLNHKIWQYYETRPEIATLYNTLWAQASQYAMEYLKDDELSYYYDVTD